MKSEITKTMIVAAVLLYFCIDMSILHAEIPCDHTALTTAGIGDKGVWRMHAADKALGPHIPYNEVLIIKYVDSLPPPIEVDTFSVKAMDMGSETFPNEPWVGRCVTDDGNYKGKYVLVGNIYLKDDDVNRCRHQLTITRTTAKVADAKTKKIPDNQILIESITTHPRSDETCDNHISGHVEPHFGDAHGGND